MKVTAIIGSARKKHSYRAAETFLGKLGTYGDIDYELVALSDYDLKICRGCKLCLDRGEERCPMKDDRDLLLEKLEQSDGIIFVSPNYSFQVSGLMKVFLDRLGFMFHRPVFFGKTFSNIVVQGVYGGRKIVKYLDFIGSALGCNVVKGCCIKTLEPMTEKEKQKTAQLLEMQCEKFYRRMKQNQYPSPSLLKLMLYRMSRTSMRLMLDEQSRDYSYFSEKEWFTSDYYYPVQLNPVKKVLGKFFDFAARKMVTAR
jgi:multimeric flavodoxin WrbA